MNNMYTNASIATNTISKMPNKLNEFIEGFVSKSGDILNSPTIEEIKKIDWTDISAILRTISILLILVVIAAIALYLLRAIGLYQMAKREGKDFAWLAFIPFGCYFTYGLITGKTKVYGVEIDHTEWLLPLILLSSCLPYVGCCSLLLFFIVKPVLLYRIYQAKSPNFAMVLFLLSIILPILSPIILFSLRDK